MNQATNNSQTIALIRSLKRSVADKQTALQSAQMVLRTAMLECGFQHYPFASPMAATGRVNLGAVPPDLLPADPYCPACARHLMFRAYGYRGGNADVRYFAVCTACDAAWEL